MNNKKKRLDSKSPREDDKTVFDFEEMMAKSDVEIRSKLFEYSDLMKQD
jgi:hypothetical protein